MPFDAPLPLLAFPQVGYQVQGRSARCLDLLWLRPLGLSSMFACLCNSQSTESQRNLACKDSQCPRGPSIKIVSDRAFVGPKFL